MRPLVLALAGVAGLSLAAWSAVPQVDPSQTALTPFQAARTERLLERRVACRGCHRIDGSGGRIGPGLDGIAERADADYVRRIIADPAGEIPGTLMPRQRIPEPDVERLAAFIMSRPVPTDGASATPPEAPPAITDAERLDGAALYARHCVACHGPEGRGDGWNASELPVRPTAHADATLMAARTDDALFDAIHAGGFVLDRSPLMPAFGELLSSEQIRALVAHIRVLCACAQPTWAER